MTEDGRAGEAPDGGLLFAFHVSPRGEAKAIGLEELRSPDTESGYTWVHFETGEASERWLGAESGLPPAVVESLVTVGARPRCSLIEDGLLVVLRGVNMNPGQDPEDMVSVRGWLTAKRVVTVRIRRVMAIQDLRSALIDGTGPRDVGTLLVGVISGLLDRIRPVVEDLEDQLDRIEDQVSAGDLEAPLQRLGELKTAAIRLRRHMAPQREAFERLREQHPRWLTKPHVAVVREASQRTARLVEDLEAILARSSVARDEIAQELAARMNRTMYRLSVIAGIFLPLSFLTGLLGINVGGMPGTDNATAFWWVCGICAVLGGFLVLVSRRMKWL